MRKKKNSLGFTLIEMIVAFSILGVAFLGIGGFLATGIRSYQNVHAESVVQNEAQTALNQIQELVIDAGLGVSYNVKTTSDNFVETDAGVTSGTVTAKYLYVYNWDNSRNTVTALIIKWDPVTQNLYYTELTNISNTTVRNASNETVSASISQVINVDSITDWDILAMGVELFTIDLSDYKDTNKITAHLKMVKQGKSYESSLIIALRNEVLINPTDIAAIYTRVDAVINTVIEGVRLSTSSNAVVKGGSVQLTTEVYGKGYPSQTIYEWLIQSVSGVTVNKDSNGVISVTGESDSSLTTIYDSLASTNAGGASIDPTTKLMDVSSGISSTLLKITAIVYVGKDEHNNPVTCFDSKYVAVKDISNFVIQPKPDLTLTANTSLSIATNEWLETSVSQTAGSTAAQTSVSSSTPSMNLYPGNVIQMYSDITGSNIDESDKNIVWAIVSPDEGVDITVTQKGQITVSRYSQQGQAILKAYPTLNPNLCLYYIINVGTQYGTGNSGLTITGKTIVNRGATLALGLKLNGTQMDQSELNDFNWSCELIDSNASGIIGTPVTIDKYGRLSVAEDMSFDYSFTVKVTAKMKSNSSVSATELITIPRVTLQMTRDTIISQRGSIIPDNTFSCVVTGIENYTLEWDLASQTNPSYYSSTVGNGSYITANGDTCSISISGSEPATLIYMRARAMLSGYSNYKAYTLISLKDISVTCSAEKDSISRGESDKFTASIKPANAGFSGNDIEWSIESIKLADGTALSTKESGISLTDASGNAATTGSSIYVAVASGYHRASQEITVTVKATVGGSISGTDSFTINASSKPTISGPTTVNRGGSITLTATDSADTEWLITNVSEGSASDITITPDSSKGTAVISPSALFNTEDATEAQYSSTISVKVHVKDTDIYSDVYKITVPAIGISISGQTASKNSYTYTASVTGFESSSMYEISWGLNTQDTVPGTLVGKGDSSEVSNTTVTVDSNTAAKATVATTTSSPAEIYVYAVLKVNGNQMDSASAKVVTFKRKTLSELKNLGHGSWKPGGKDNEYTIEINHVNASSYSHKHSPYHKSCKYYYDSDSGNYYYRCYVSSYSNSSNGNAYYNYLSPKPQNQNYYYLTTDGTSWYYLNSEKDSDWKTNPITASSGTSCSDVFGFSSTHSAYEICSKIAERTSGTLN